MTRVTLISALGAMLLFSACTAPVEAPEELGELLLYLYSNYESETGDELVAGAAQMEEYLLSIDLAADVDDRAVTPPLLTDEYLGEAVRPPDADPEKQVPVALSTQSANSLDDALTLIADTNQVCIANDSYLHYERDWLTDIDAFVYLLFLVWIVACGSGPLAADRLLGEPLRQRLSAGRLARVFEGEAATA